MNKVTKNINDMGKDKGFPLVSYDFLGLRIIKISFK